MGKTVSVVFSFHCILRNGSTGIEYITVRNGYSSGYQNSAFCSASHTKTSQFLILSSCSLCAVAVTYFLHFTPFRLRFDIVYVWCLYKQKCFDKNRTENRKWGKQNRDFDLKVILYKVAISMSMLKIVTPLKSLPTSRLRWGKPPYKTQGRFFYCRLNLKLVDLSFT